MGSAAASASGGLVEFAQCSEKNSERDAHRLIAGKFKLALPIPLTPLPKTPGVVYPGQIKVLSLKHWMQFLIDKRLWHMVIGLKKSNPERERSILSEFWRRYKCLYPTHEIFSLLNHDLSRCCPILLHGDEGRGRKKSGFLVVSYHSYLGLGSNEANRARKCRPFNSMRLNYSGDIFCNRFLTSVLPKMLKDDQALKDILSFVAQDCRQMLIEGVRNKEGETFTMCCLQCIGDWQWLVKSGQLARSYSSVEKRPRREGAQPVGICHQCEAGRCGLPWENYQANAMPVWWPTRFKSSPFVEIPALIQLAGVRGQEPDFFTWDLFHSYHLGVGKTFVATCLALASECMSATHVDERFAQLTALYLSYCEERHKAPYMTALTRSQVGWPDASTYPNGYWSKGHLTTLLCEFFEDWASSQAVFRANHELLSMCRESAASCIHQMFGCPALKLKPLLVLV